MTVAEAGQIADANPPSDCQLCPRLVTLRHDLQRSEPDWHNAPVDTFGSLNARLLVLGLAPGARGANRTGRPFTGDFAGNLLYQTLREFGFAEGEYAADCDDGLVLKDCAISNAVRCVPPHNKPLPAEIKTCMQFLRTTLGAMQDVKVIVALGRIAHESFVRSMGFPLKAAVFRHGSRHVLETGERCLTLFDSYHCSRYNTNTGVLTPQMFKAVFADVKDFLTNDRAS